MKKITMLLSLSLAFILTFSACEGPMGPSGPRGLDGMDGTGGNTGMKTVFFNMAMQDWTPTGDKGRWFYSLQMPEVTQDVVDNGAVLCYRRNIINGIETFEAMPVTTLIEENGVLFSNEIWYSHYNGYIDFDWWDSHPTEPLSPGYDMYFKIVILYPMYAYKLKNVDVNDYQAVSKALELDKLSPDFQTKIDSKVK